MTRFVTSLAFLVASATTMSAMRIPDSLKDVANSETMRVPALRSKEAERKNVFQHKIASMVSKRRLADEDEYDGEYAWDQSMDQTTIGFDITSYAIKYTQCSTVQTYSDDLAQDENVDTVLAAKRFALFRLCPKDQCSSSSSTGCGSNYGEYIVSLDQFLVAMLEYQEHRVAGYCEYCQNCASIEAAKSFWKNLYALRTSTLETVEASYQTWYTNYLESYASGNGNNDAYSNVDANTAAKLYYEQTRNSNNYANNYAANNYYSGSSSSSSSSNSGSSSASQYQWQNQANWEFQNSQTRVYNNQESWTNMASRGGTWYGRQILNGYYENGAFVQDYGYFNSEGQYISLQDDAIEWDDTLYGEMPDGWDEIDANTESCSYKYAGSCYNQFDACMQILQDQDYQATQAAASGGYYSNQQQAQEAYTQKATLKDFLGCVEVDPMAQYTNANAQSEYSQQQSYGSQVQNFNCYDGDEACAKAQEYANQMYAYEQEKNANRRYFIGPHCGSNARDIGLAVYQDEYCSVVDSKSTVENVLGYAPYSSAINLFPDECLSCFPDEVSLSNVICFLVSIHTNEHTPFDLHRHKKRGTKTKKYTPLNPCAPCSTNMQESATSI
jgi:hypothetical protein